MKRVDLPGVALVLLLCGFLLAAVLVPPPLDAPDDRAALTYTVRPRAPVAWVLPPDVARVKLVAIAERPADQPLDPTHELPFALDLTWRDASGAPLAEERLALRAAPAIPAPWTGQAPAAVALPRTARLLVPPGLGAAGLEITVPEGGPSVRLRVFRDVPVPLGTPELALLGVDDRLTRTFAKQLGLASWDEVTSDEALALAVTRWEALPVRRAGLPPGASGVTHLPEPALASQARRTLGEPLGAGRALAWSLVGPVQATLLSDVPLDMARLGAVVEDLGPMTVTTFPQPAPGWWPGAHAMGITLASPGSLTLHLGAGPAAGRVLLVLAHAAQVDAAAEAGPVAAFAQGPSPGILSVVPARTSLTRAVVDAAGVSWIAPTTTEATILRLEVRALGPDADPLPLEVQVESQGGVRSVDLVLENVPSTYDDAGPEDAPRADRVPVGEPVMRYLLLPPGSQGITLRTRDGRRALAELEVEGPTRGSRDALDLSGRTTVRYARDVHTAWRALAPEAATLWRVDVQTRREVAPTDPAAPELDPEARAWTVVEPKSDDRTRPGEAWLVPRSPTDAGDHGQVWCRVTPEVPTSIAWTGAAAAEAGLALGGVVWTDRPSGTPWRLTVDGRDAAKGALSMASARWSRAVQPGRSFLLHAPAGTTAWVRVPAVGFRPCSEAWRARRVLALSPGATATWRLDKPPGDMLLVVGGFGRAALDVVVELVPVSGAGAPLIVGAWTSRQRTLTLPLREDGATAQALDTPWDRLPALQSAGMRLKEDLQGPIDVRVRSLGDAPVQLFLLAERVPGASTTPAPSLRRIEGAP